MSERRYRILFEHYRLETAAETYLGALPKIEHNELQTAQGDLIASYDNGLWLFEGDRYTDIQIEEDITDKDEQ